LNVARQAFENTVRLSPAFHLGYGHLFDIHSKVAAATWASEAQGFELPRGDLIAPWESSRSPASQRSFLPVVLDSIVWVDHAAFAALDPLQTRGGAQRLEDDLLRVLRRWVASAPDAVRPNREMTSWILDQLARLRRGDHLLAPERIDGMLRIAREHAVKALALSPDTVAEDLFQLADLHLAVGDIEAARTQVESALRMTGEPGSQRMAANVFMATGQVGRLLLLDLEDSRQPFFRDEQTGTFIPYGEGHVAVQRLRLLGATGVGGAPLSAALRQLDRAWSTAGHSDREQRLLRQSATWSVAPALALEPEAMRRWMEWLEQPESLLATLLRVHEGLTRVDRSNASTTAALEDPARTYVRALTEQLSGDHESALRSLSRLDSVPPLIGAIDPVWGFRSLSHALKAQSYEALGDSAAAQDSRSRFLELWGNADTLAASQTWLSEARVAAERRIPPPRP
jgi:tetratricopeptide (TPR) repeat protein